MTALRRWAKSMVAATGYVRPQWKGTTLCADWECPACGKQVHTDSDYIFLHSIQCVECGQWFVLSPRIEIVAIETERGTGNEPSYEVARRVFGDDA
jgi:hypothetical protein